jgi:hypothetical protein
LEQLKARFFKQDVICIGKIVPNQRRDQDTIILELMLPEDIDFENKVKSTYQMLTAFLLISNHILINMDEEIDLKNKMAQTA